MSDAVPGPVRLRPNACYPEREAAILLAYDGGQTIASIAADHGVSQQCIAQIVRRYRPSTRRPTVNWTPALDGALARLWAEGLSARRIGVTLGVGRDAVIGRAHRLHLPARPSPIRRSST